MFKNICTFIFLKKGEKMNFKKIMLITLLLAVLTIGAVSATEDVDALAVNDAGDEAIVESPVDEDATETAIADEDVIEDDQSNLSPEDFNVTFPTNEFDMDKEDPAVITYFTPEGIDQYSSWFVVYYGDGDYDRRTIQMELADVGTYKNLTLGDILYMSDPGVYNLRVYYSGDGLRNFTELGKATINVTYNHEYTAEDFIYIYTYVSNEVDEDWLAEIYDDEIKGLDGVVTAYANGAKIYSKTYSNYTKGGPIHINDLTGSFNGAYTIKIEYKRADGKVFSTSKEVYFDNIVGASSIKTTLTASPTSVSMAYNTNKVLTVTLMDANKNPIKNQYIKVYVMGVSYDLKTDNNGKIKQSLSTLPPKTHNIKFEFKDAAPYKGSTKTVTVKVTKATPKITAKAKTLKRSDKTKKYSVTLNVNQKVKVTIKVNKKTYTAYTTAKGVATFKLNKLTKKGKYTGTVSFAGNPDYNKAKSVNVKITVK